jgi:peptidyl-Lys metalloendopeptidase
MFFALLLASASAGSLEVTLSEVSFGVLQFEVTNLGTEQVQFPTWFTPFDPMMPLYNFQFEPAAEYLGLAAKRVASTEPLVTIEPGASIKKNFQPQSQWDLREQVYTISWPGRPGLYVAPAKLAFKAQAGVKKPQPNTTQDDHLLGYTMTNCGASTTAKYKNVQYGVSLAVAANTKAKNCLTGNTCGTVYTDWYGAQTSARLTSITSKHNKIATAFTGSWIAYCDGSECAANVYAYVYPSDAKKNMYLCKTFYDHTDPIELTNTPVHEMSHFTAVAGTQDYQYGVSACKNLAKTNPDRAISNADNLGYFAYYAK